MKNKTFGIFALSLLLQACAGSSSGNGSNGGGGTGSGETQAMRDASQKCANAPQGSSIRYVMSQNDNGNACTTGCQIFYSGTAYCDGLRNDSLNNNCAKAEREKTYKENCTAVP